MKTQSPQLTQEFVRRFQSCFFLILLLLFSAQVPAQVTLCSSLNLSTSKTNVSCNGANNGTATVTPSGGTAPYTYSWSNGATTPTITGLAPGTYTVTVTDNSCQPSGIELVTNGNFSSGNTGFSSSYNHCTGSGCLVPEGNYAVSSNPTFFHSSFVGTGHGGSGNFMIVNGVGTPNTSVWCQTISVTPNTTYVFSTWVCSVHPTSPAQLQFSINGTPLGSIFSAPGTINTWTQFYTTWYSGSATSASICIVNQNTTANGNDFGLDDISFQKCLPCTKTASVTITEPTPLTASISMSANINCFGGTNGLANVAASGGTAPYTYSWSNGATTALNTGLSAGTYTVTVTDSKGCTATTSVTLSQPTALSVSFPTSTNVSCNGGNNGSATASASGGTPSYSYLWSTGATTASISGLGAGTYTVTVTDNRGCVATNSITITQPPILTASISASTNVNCFGGNTGSATVTGAGGTAPYSYLWSNGATTATANNLTAGTYTVTITDSKGCTANASVTITQPASAVNVTIPTSVNVNCNGGNNGSANASASGGTAPYTYLWSNGATTASISSLTAGTYSVTVTDNKGCTATASVNITQPTLLSVTIPASVNVNCFGGNNGSATASPSGGTAPYSYLWSNGATTASIGSLTAGTYSVTVTDSKGCTANASITITQPASALSASISSSTNVNCFGGNTGAATVSAAGGTAPYTYLWSNGATTASISSLTAGTYSVTVTDNKGCTTTASVTITQPAAALTATGIITNVSCTGGSNGAINLTPSGGTGPYTFSWNNGATTEDISGLSSGLYSVNITDANGCTYHYTGMIAQPLAALNATSVVSGVLCFGGNSGSVNLTVTGGTGPYTFVWSNGAATEDINSLTAGSYSVTVTDANGCTASHTANVSQPAAAVSISGATTNVLCFAGNNGAVNITVTGGTGPYTFAWSNGATTEDINSLTAGTYSVTVTDANGCTATYSTTVTQPAAALNATGSVTNVLCFAGNNGAINITVTGGTAPYSFVWSNGATTEDIGSLAAGTYSVTVTDANNCTFNYTATVTQPAAALSISGVITNVLCFAGNNGAVNITVTGGTAPYSFVWSNGATTEDIGSLTAGIYSVTVTDANGCTASYSATVTQPAAALNATGTTVDVLCFAGNNGSIDITVTGGTAPYTFVWSNGATTEDISTLTAGNYSVAITDANGCTFNYNATINQPAAPLNATGITVDVLCFGGNNGSIDITVTGGTAPYTFLWNTGATTEDISTLAAGNYSVVIIDANGCTFNYAATINQPAAALNATGTVTDVLCFGGNNGSVNITVTGGTAPYSFVWSNGATAEDINTLTAGNYSVVITDANGCTVNYAATVTQPAAALNATGTTVDVLCFGGNNGSIDITVTGGTAPYSFVWSNGATTEDISTLTAGTYSVVITDANGCTFNYAATINQPAAPLNATGTTVDVLCFGGNNGSVDIAVTGGTAPYTFLWNNGATTEDISTLTAGNYSVVITDANGCTFNYAATINQPAAALNATGTTVDVLCFGGNNGSVDITVTGGTAPYSFVWSNGAATEDISTLTAGTYSVTVTDANGCTFNYSATINQPAAPLNATGTTVDVLCFGGNNGSVDITVTGGTAPYSFVWSNGAATEDISTLTAGNYSVVITDDNGCTFNYNATINQPAAPLNATGTTVDVLCFAGNNGSVDITVTGGTAPYTFAWSNGATTEDINSLTAGNYSVVVTDDNGCTFNYSATINQPAATLNATGITVDVLCFGGNNGSVDITVTGGTAPYTFVWSNGATTEDISTLTAGNYAVVITDANGCTFNYSATINQPAAPLNATGTTVDVLCFGGNNGSIDITVSGGTAPYTFVWSNSATTEDISTLTAGNYSVVITDANGCTFNYSATINQPAAPLNATGTTIDVLCFAGNNGSVDITVTGGTAPYTFVWSNGATTEDIGTLTAGTYSVTVTDANGCTFSYSATINQPAAPLNATGTAVDVLCFAGNNGSVDITVTGGTAPYTFVWNNGATTEDINTLIAGNYSVIVTDANGCTFNYSATINQPAAPLNATGTTIDVLCFAGNNGSVDITVTGGTAPYTFVWSNGATTEDISTLTAGNYSVVITDANGCTFNYSATINQPAAPLNTTGTTVDVLCFAGNNGSIDITVTGGTAPYTFVWSNGTTTEDINTLTAGNYSVVITDANGCTFNYSATINQPAAPLNATGITLDVLCFGGNNGSVDITVTGGTAPYTFVWSNGAATEDINTLTSGNYSVIVTDANGCTFNYSATINQPAAPLNATGIIVDVLCFGGNNGSADITVTGGTAPYTFVWSNGAITEDINTLIAGNYSVVITDNNGCTFNYNATVNQPAATLNATGTTVDVLCFGGNNGSVDITVTGGTAPYTFVWSNGATTEDISTLTSGNYSVVVTDANGCTFNYAATINQPAAALAISGLITDVLCFNGNNGAIDITVTGGTAPYAFSWNNGAVTEDINSLSAGSYTVTVTDANGCSDTYTGVVNQPAAALNVTGQITDVLCFGGNGGIVDITVTGGTAPYTFTWSDGSVTEDINMLIAGTYSVTVTDANGCTFNYTATVTEPAAPLTVTGVITDVLCFAGNTGSLDITVSGGTAPYTFNWSNGASTEDINTLTAGNYTAIVTDANNCVVNFTATVAQPAAALNVTGIPVNILCAGSGNGSIDVTVSGGILPYNFSWSNGASTEDIFSLIPGLYSLNVTDANGCTDQTYSQVILELPGFDVQVQLSAPHCFGGNDGSIDLTVSGGLPLYQFSWDNGATTEDLSGLSQGTYTVTITDLNGCTFQDSYTLNAPPQALAVSGSVSDILCNGMNSGAINASGSGGTAPYIYTWSHGSITEDVTNLPPGSYTLTITDAANCTAQAQFTVTEPAPLDLSAILTPNRCYGESNASIDLGISGGTAPYDFTWSNGATTEDLGGIMPGSYSVVAIDANGCSVTDNYNVAATTLVTVVLDPEHEIYAGESVLLDPQVSGGNGGYTYTWTPDDNLSCSDCQSPEASPLINTAYTVTVTDSKGCTAEASTLIIVKNEIFFPNAFTPDGDGLNDTFGPSNAIVKEYTLQVFDRWGKNIFETKKIDERWDGTHLGVESPLGSYVYKADVVFYNGETRTFTSKLILIR